MARRISIRRILQTVTTLVALTGVVLAISAAGNLRQNDRIRQVVVSISNPKDAGFIDRSAVMQSLFTDRHIDPAALQVAKVDVHRMESILRSNPWISRSEVWVDAANDLHLHITQRVPSVRIYDEHGRGYYLDTALSVIPLSDRYVHYAPVITGVPELHDDSVSDAVRGRIRYFFNVVNKDTFWRVQVAQAVLHDGRNFEIVPLLGKQRIILGDTSELPAKLSRLFRFYSNVLNNIGWDKYDTLDARFAGQVVARPALAWKKPVNTVAGGDGWMKVILEAGPKEQSNMDGSPILLGAAPAAPAATPTVTASPAPAAKPAAPKAAAPSPKPKTETAPKGPTPKPAAPKPGTPKKPAAKPATAAAKPAKAASKPAAAPKRTSPAPAVTKPIQKPTRE